MKSKIPSVTLFDLVDIITGGEAYTVVTQWVAALEADYKTVGAVVRVSFDLPVLRWGASVSVWHHGRLYNRDIRGAFKASDAVSKAGFLLATRYWEEPEEPRCQKCGGLGVECVDEENETHLRYCDCPTGVAKKKESL